MSITLRADYACHSRCDFIAAPGGGTSGFDPLGVRHVMTCFDMDYLKNWHVENAYRNLVALLGKQDITFGTYLWVPDHNGLDDYIWEFCLNQGKRQSSS